MDGPELFGTGAGEQFKARVAMEQSPFNIGLGYDIQKQIAALVQNGGENFIIFLHPGDMREIAQTLIREAGLWERGEVEGLSPPQ
jgi:hypothetical protein